MKIPRREFYMARHGQTVHNVTGYLSSNTTELTDHGVNQAVEAAKVFEQILNEKDCEIFTSDLNRAKHTAIMMVDRPPSHLEKDARLNERDMGSEAGITKYADYWNRFGTAKDQGLDPIAQFEGMESIEAHSKRVAQAIEERLGKSPKDRTPAFICHEGVIRRVVESMGVEGSHFDNAGIYHFVPVGEKGWKISKVKLENEKPADELLWDTNVSKSVTIGNASAGIGITAGTGR